MTDAHEVRRRIGLAGQYAALHELWARVRELVGQGTTVLLTTRYLEEADRLADQVVVVDSGRVIADGTPEELKCKAGREWLDVTVGGGEGTAAALAAVRDALPTATVVDRGRDCLAIPVDDGIGAAADAAGALRGAGVDVTGFALRRPTLDDVFAQLTGSLDDHSGVGTTSGSRPAP